MADAVISGWILDPDRQQAVEVHGQLRSPRSALLEQLRGRRLRYWAAGERAGVDTALDEGQMRVGRRLATKLLHASRFVLSSRPALAPPRPPRPWTGPCWPGWPGWSTRPPPPSRPTSRARALEATEAFFWTFCDHYLELVKGRAYGEDGPAGQASAVGSLRLALDTLVRLFAPVLPFVTEEVWSWWRDGSIHRSPWPEGGPLRAATGVERPSPLALEAATAVLAEVRRAKTAARRSLRTPVRRVEVADRPERVAILAEVAGDLRRAGAIGDLVLLEPADTLTVRVDLGG